MTNTAYRDNSPVKKPLQLYSARTLLVQCSVSVIVLVLALLYAIMLLVADQTARPTIYKDMRSTVEKGFVSAANSQFPSYFERIIFSEDPDHSPEMGVASHLWQTVEIPSREQPMLLRGWFVKAAPQHSDADYQSDVTVVMIHGAFIDRRFMSRFIPFLHQSGYNALLFDHRDHGISDGGNVDSAGGGGRGNSLGVREHEDVVDVVQWLKTQFGGGKYAKRVVLFGTSCGASSAIMSTAVAAKEKNRMADVDAIVAENPFSSRVAQIYDAMYKVFKEGIWGPERIEDIAFEIRLPFIASQSEGGRDDKNNNGIIRVSVGVALKSLAEKVPDWAIWGLAQFAERQMRNGHADPVPEPIDVVHLVPPRPMMLIHSEEDVMVPIYHSERLHKAANSSTTTFWRVKKGAHSNLYNAQKDEFIKRFLSFLEENNLTPPKRVTPKQEKPKLEEKLKSKKSKTEKSKQETPKADKPKSKASAPVVEGQ